MEKNNNKAGFNKEDIDSMDTMVTIVGHAQKTNKALEAVGNYPESKTEIEILQERRERLKREQERLKNKRKTNFKRMVATILAATTLSGTAYLGVKLGKKIENNSKVNDIVDSLIKSAEDNLIANGLGTRENDKFKIGNNTVEDYGSLEANSGIEVYVYKKVIDDFEEFSKFIQSVTYDDGTYHYINYDQFLEINGYYELDTNKTSNVVFENMVESTILSAYENSTVSSLEEEFYTTDLGNNNRTR